MMDGFITYQGLAKDSVHHFAKIGLTCPLRSNPADFYMKILAVNYPKGPEDEKYIKRLSDHYIKNIQSDILTQAA